MLFALAAHAWWLDWQGGEDSLMGFMSDMNLEEAALFCPMWVVMSVAMMLPTIFPIVLVQRFVAESRKEGWATTAALILGYLTTWLVISVIALGRVSLVAMALMNRPEWVGTTLAGMILLATGVFQFSSWRKRCLQSCRHPVSFVEAHDAGVGGVAVWFKAGFAHGLFCIGCCASLMSIMTLLGLMNAPWMAVGSVVFFAEKNWRYGVELGWGVGAVMMAIGGLVLLSLVPSLGVTTL
jgi:predicted metal-binding membrane protein